MSGLGQGKDEAKRLYDAKQYTEAIAYLQEYLEGTPDDTAARAILAASFAQIGSSAESISEFAMLTEMDPGNPRHFCNLGIAFKSAGELDKAQEQFEKALALKPEYQMAKKQLAALTGPAPQAAAAPPSQPSIRPMAPKESVDTRVSEAPQQAPARREARPQAVTQMRGDGLTTTPPGLNWGAFLLPFWWSIAHSAWVWLVVSLFAPLIASIYLLIKGNEIAFQNRKFTGLTQFRAVQRAWAIWGLGIFLVQVILIVVMYGSMFAMFFKGMSSMNMSEEDFTSMMESDPNFSSEDFEMPEMPNRGGRGPR